MTRQEYDEKMVEVMHLYYQEIHNAIVNLTNKYIEDNPDRPSYFYTLVSCDRFLDGLAMDRAWVEDRINDGVTSYRPRRRTKKIRKALGYAYP